MLAAHDALDDIGGEQTQVHHPGHVPRAHPGFLRDCPDAGASARGQSTQPFLGLRQQPDQLGIWRSPGIAIRTVHDQTNRRAAALQSGRYLQHRDGLRGIVYITWFTNPVESEANRDLVGQDDDAIDAPSESNR
jgi:hypothetical protein